MHINLGIHWYGTQQGINQMTKVWLEALAAGTNEVAIDNAVSLVSENVEAVIGEFLDADDLVSEPKY